MSELTKNTLDEFFGTHTSNIDYRGKLNDEQYQAVMTTEGPELIIAGAGSGKTTVLTYRLAYLIEKGVSPDRILLLTFTNKAANEMITRALSMLGTNMRINGGTFHSFCAKLLRQYHEEAELSRDFLIRDSAESADMINYIKGMIGLEKEKDFPNGAQMASMFSMSINKAMTIEEVVEKLYNGKFLDYIEEIKQVREAYKKYKEERNMLDYDDLLLKTNKLLRENERVCKDVSDIYDYIMVDEYQDSNMLQFELISLLRRFENKNICVVGDDQQCLIEGTMIETTRGKLPVETITIRDKLIVASGYGNCKAKNPKDVSKRHYEGYVYKITTKWGRTITVTGDHTIFADDKEKINNIDKADFYMFGGPSDKEMGNLHKFIVDDDKLRDRLNHIDSEDVGRALDEISKVLSEPEYSYLTHERFAYIAKKHPFKFIEAKDVKPGMCLPVYRDDTKTISGDIVESVEEILYNGYVYDINVDYYMNYIANNICVHNCIYGFRGANHKNILNFPKQFVPCNTVILYRNYRSNQEILDFTNEVAMEAKERFDKELLGTHSSGHKPQLIYVNDEMQQAQACFYDIIKRHMNGTPLKEMAVLIRASKDSNALESLMMRFSQQYPIPFQKFGGIKFMERSFVRDSLAFLKVLVNEKDEIAWFRIFQLYINIGPVYAKRLVEGINQQGIEYLKDKKHVGKKYGECLPIIYDWYNELKPLDLCDQIDKIINEHYWKARNITIDNRKSRQSVISDERKKLDDEITEAQVLIDVCKPYKTASEFLNDITLEANMNDDTSDDILTISTVHSAKGLEYDTVYILGCAEGIFPWKVDDEIEEERRVFYVAATRAKENLIMYVPNEIYQWGSTKKVKISPFLKNTRYFCNEITID